MLDGSIKIILILTILIFNSACTLSLDTFGKISPASLTDEQLPKEIEGNFPLGKAPFAAEEIAKICPSTGNRFVALDTLKKKILIYTSEGTIIKEVQLLKNSAFFPTTMGVDSQGIIYVVARDESASPAPSTESVLKFDSNGNSLGTFMEFSRELSGGSLENPGVHQIRFDSADNIYFGMYYFDQVRLYNKTSGNLMKAYGMGSGLGNGEFFGHLESFTVDSGGYIWATDGASQRLQKFKPDGSYDSQILLPQSSQTGDLAVLDDGKILIAEIGGGSTRLLALNSSGATVYSQDGALGGGTAYLPVGNPLTFSVVGNEIFAGHWSDVRVFDRDTGMPLRSFGPTLKQPLAVARDNAGNTYVSEFAGGIKRFDKNGAKDLTFATGTVFYDLHCDSKGTIYAPDAANKKIKKFSTAGDPLGDIPVTGSIYHMDISADDIIYAADLENGLIRKYDTAGNPLGTLAQGKVVAPGGISVTKDGGVVIVDSASAVILGPYRALVKVNADNTVAWELPAGQEGIDMAFGVAINAQDEIFVTDVANNNITRLNPAGQSITTISQPGINFGQLTQPTGITLDDFGNIYVTEFGNSRVQKFNSAGVAKAE